MIKIVVFISGRGSNLEALLKDENNYQVCHVISNKQDIKGLAIAHAQGVTNSYINWSDRNRAEQISTNIIKGEAPDLIVLAGFMKILSTEFTDRFKNKIINIHPSLLPEYPGLNTHQRVLDDNKTTHGASIHFVDGLLDHGKTISQIQIPVDHNDTAKTLANKLITKEHKLLTLTVGLIAKQQIYWQNGCLLFNGKPLEKPLVIE